MKTFGILFVALSMLLCDSFKILQKTAAGLAICLSLAEKSLAEEDLALPPPVMKDVTATVTMNISMNRKEPKQVKMEIYGKTAPIASRSFLSICTGDNPYGTVSEKFSYQGTLASRVVKGQDITFGKFYKGGNQKLGTVMDDYGKVKMQTTNLADEVKWVDRNEFVHTFGTVSVPKNGGSFEFAISPGDRSKTLDEKNVVIGQVIADESSTEIINAINNVPVSKEDPLKMKSGFAAAGKGFDPRAKIISLNRPLQRIEVLDCEVNQKASLTSLLGGG